MEKPPESITGVDLVTSAQAAHWFDLPTFYGAVKTVARPGAVVALWCYERCRINSAADALVEEYYQYLDPFWPPERCLVEAGHRGIKFPFEEIESPLFELKCHWDCEAMLVYLESWSATQRCAKAMDTDPLESLRGDLNGMGRCRM